MRNGLQRFNAIVEGVTNVVAFGAFVDVGVQQDGLVHVSAMANSVVKNPRAVAKSGDVVKVKVLSVDILRKRIALTMRRADAQSAGEPARVLRAGDAKAGAVRAVNAEAARPLPAAERWRRPCGEQRSKGAAS